jgi:hypothetical protein
MNYIIKDRTAPISDKQLEFLIILAWRRTGADEADIESYRTSFRNMTKGAASDLIATWTALPELRKDDPPAALDAGVPATLPSAPVRAAIAGQYTPNTAGVYECYTCKATFSTMKVLMDHKKLAHQYRSGRPVQPAAAPVPAPLAPPAATAVAANMPAPTPTPAPAPTPRPTPYELPERGYYAVELPFGPNNEMVWRFYRVTQKRKPYQGVKNFMRQSGDNWMGWIEPTERQMAAAIIKAAPALAMEAYGKLIGSCGCCGRSLTDPNSRALGIGPECIKTYKSRGKA